MRCWPAEPGAFRPQLAHRPQPSLCNPLPRDPVTLPLDVAQWRQKDSPRIPVTFLSGTIILRGESEYNLFVRLFRHSDCNRIPFPLSLIHISEPTRLGMISYAVFCLKKK